MMRKFRKNIISFACQCYNVHSSLPLSATRFQYLLCDVSAFVLTSHKHRNIIITDYWLLLNATFSTLFRNQHTLTHIHSSANKSAAHGFAHSLDSLSPARLSEPLCNQNNFVSILCAGVLGIELTVRVDTLGEIAFFAQFPEILRGCCCFVCVYGRARGAMKADA